jgi:hypothetical protein
VDNSKNTLLATPHYRLVKTNCIYRLSAALLREGEAITLPYTKGKTHTNTKEKNDFPKHLNV